MLFGTKQAVGKLTIVNMHKRPKKAVDCRKPPAVDVFIGRGSVLGNEHHIGADGTRDEVCDWYDADLARKVKRGHSAVCQELDRIADLLDKGHDVNLVCYCAPERCHGLSVEKQVKRSTRKKKA